LRAAGAEIYGAGSSMIVVRGVKKLNDVEYKIMPDRIVAGTYLAAGAITRGRVRLNDVNVSDIAPVMMALTMMGADIYIQDKSVVLQAGSKLAPLKKLTTAPHSGFPTDVQPQFTSLLATIAGESTIEENIFDARDSHVDELNKMGANIKNIDRKRFEIEGVQQLHGADVTAKDLRSGAALILAGLAAKGETTVQGAKYVKRGYEAIENDLQQLGADITIN